MVSTYEIESKLKQIKPLLADKYHVSAIGYFGSFAKGQQTDKSDLDLLVSFSRPIGWDFFALEFFLEQTLGIHVDLVTPNALKSVIKESILNQVRYV
jgi:predicted nucleotidyltransferase